MRKIVLFDMDGTLTPPREHLDYSLVETLTQLSNYAEIGIVSGSDYEYIMQQCGFLTTKDEIKLKLHILPCNGTMHYAPPLYREQKMKLIHQNDMRKVLGDSDLNKLFKKIINYQDHIVSHYDIPLTGHFVSYRGSMINWCPIGRNATKEDRKSFINFDKTNGFSSFRRTILTQLKEEFKNARIDVTVKLGGETSFDIFLMAGIKLIHCHISQIIRFGFLEIDVGTMGMIKEIFDALQPECSFWVDGTKHTQEILEEILIPKLRRGMKQVKSILKRALKHGFDLSGIKNYNLEKFKDGLFEHLVDNKYYVFEEDESLFVGYFAYEDTAKVYFYEEIMKVEPIQESGFFEILIELFRYISIAREESMIEKDLGDDETTEDYSAEDSDSESEELWL